MGLKTVDAKLRTLATGLVVGESPRWHDGRLWFANWGAQEIRTLDAEGKSDVIARAPKPVGYSIDWLPNSDLLVTSEEGILRRTSDGSFVTHADLRALGHTWNEITVDGRGNVYVNDVGFVFGQEQFRPGIIALVTPVAPYARSPTTLPFLTGWWSRPTTRP